MKYTIKNPLFTYGKLPTDPKKIKLINNKISFLPLKNYQQIVSMGNEERIIRW